MAIDSFIPSKGTQQLFADYVESTKSLYTLAEQCYGGTLPNAFGLEFRSLLTHISRAEEALRADGASEASTNEKANEELQKAGRHLQRIKLDSLKLICDSLEEQSSDRIARLDRKCPLRDVEDGKFIKDVLAEQSKARKQFGEAKNADCAGAGDIVDLYSEAAAQYVSLAKLVGLSCVKRLSPTRANRIRDLEKKERLDKAKGWALLFASILAALISFMM